jgi:hypothetical protein
MSLEISRPNGRWKFVPKKKKRILMIFQHSALYTSMCCFVHTTIASFLFCLTFIGWSTSKIYKFLFLWLVCYFVSEYLLSQFTAVVVTAGAASKYLILFTQY